VYNKNRIDNLFREYIFTGDDRILGQLIEALSPMIDVVLSRWTTHKRFFEDAQQEIKLKLWKNLRGFERLEKQTINPSSYLFFLLRNYARRVLGHLPPDVFLTSLDDILTQRSESTY